MNDNREVAFVHPNPSGPVKITHYALIEERKRNWWQRLLRRPTGRVIATGELNGATTITATHTPVYLKLAEPKIEDQ
jgi:hypothetical protein